MSVENTASFFSLLVVTFAALPCAGCTSTNFGLSPTSPEPGQACAAKIANAGGANNALQSMQGTALSDWTAGGPLSIVCSNFSQGLELSLSGATPKVGATYAVTTDSKASGNTAIVKYGESSAGSNGASSNRTWRGTSGTVSIDATAKNTVSFSLASVTAEIDPEASQNLATGSVNVSGSGQVSDVYGFTP